MNRPLPSLVRFQELSATHIEILDLRRREGGTHKAEVDVKIIPWGLVIYGVSLVFRQGKWTTALPTKEIREKGRFPRRVPTCEFTTHAKRYFDQAVLGAANEYRGGQGVRPATVLDQFADAGKTDGIEPDE